MIISKKSRSANYLASFLFLRTLQPVDHPLCGNKSVIRQTLRDTSCSADRFSISEPKTHRNPLSELSLMNPRIAGGSHPVFAHPLRREKQGKSTDELQLVETKLISRHRSQDAPITIRLINLASRHSRYVRKLTSSCTLTVDR